MALLMLRTDRDIVLEVPQELEAANRDMMANLTGPRLGRQRYRSVFIRHRRREGRGWATAIDLSRDRRDLLLHLRRVRPVGYFIDDPGNALTHAYQELAALFMDQKTDKFGLKSPNAARGKRLRIAFQLRRKSVARGQREDAEALAVEQTVQLFAQIAQSIVALSGPRDILLVDDNEHRLTGSHGAAQKTDFFFPKRALIARHQDKGIGLRKEPLRRPRILDDRGAKTGCVDEMESSPQELFWQLYLGDGHSTIVTRISLLGDVLRQCGQRHLLRNAEASEMNNRLLLAPIGDGSSSMPRRMNAVLVA